MSHQWMIREERLRCRRELHRLCVVRETPKEIKWRLLRWHQYMCRRRANEHMYCMPKCFHLSITYVCINASSGLPLNALNICLVKLWYITVSKIHTSTIIVDNFNGSNNFVNAANWSLLNYKANYGVAIFTNIICTVLVNIALYVPTYCITKWHSGG